MSTKKKSNAGRPTVMTPEVIRKLYEAFAWGCSDLEACFYADISKTALYEYQEKHPEFTERKESLKQRPVLMARQSVVKDLVNNSDLALKFLERKVKEEFSTRKEMTGKDGADLVPKTTINLNE